MVTLAQRIEALRTERGMSRPALAAALGLPRMSIEKFETGRQTPSHDQQKKMAAYFQVPLAYLRGETSDLTEMSDWMDGAFLSTPETPAPLRRSRPAPKAAKAAAPTGGGESMFDAFLNSKKFQDALQKAALEALRSPEGQKLLANAIRAQRNK